MTKIVIVGAGPAGLLAAHYLLQRSNNQVVIVEKRCDFQSIAFQGDRTFPIALQYRGLKAIREIPGLENALERPISGDGNGGDDNNDSFRSVWTVGMSLHDTKTNKERKINRPPMLSAERNHIVSTFLRELRKVEPAEGSSLEIHFDTAVVDVDVPNKTLKVAKQQLEEKKSDANNKEEQQADVSYDVLIVSDGARSKIRHLLQEKKLLEFQQTTTPDVYKSFYLLRSSKDGTIKLDEDRVHGWMFGDHRVISVPTRARESSGVYIFPAGNDPFSSLPSAQAVMDYLESVSPTSLAPLVSLEEAESLRTRPVSSNVEVTCNRLTVENQQIVLLGDAAHAVSASLGQGCNSALQDVQVLMKCVDQYPDEGNWTKALELYNQERLPEAHAVGELSSFNTPRNRWMRLEFVVRMILTSILPKWLSNLLLRPMPQQLLSDNNLSYSEVLEKSRWWTDRVKQSC